jgi:hypothetical protein
MSEDITPKKNIETDRAVLNRIAAGWLSIEDDEKAWIINEILEAGFSIHADSATTEYAVLLDGSGSADEYPTAQHAIAAAANFGGEPIFRNVTDYDRLPNLDGSYPQRFRATVRGIANQFVYQDDEGWWFSLNPIDGSYYHDPADVRDVEELDEGVAL